MAINFGYPLSPMKAMLSNAASIADPTQWAMEIKWNGVRVQAHITPDDHKLFTHNGRDITPLFPEMIQLQAVTKSFTAVLDGTMVIFSGDEIHTQDRDLIQRRLRLVDPSAVTNLARARPAVFQVFDLLYLDGSDLTKLAYAQRRKLLEQHCSGTPYVSIPSIFIGVDPHAVLRLAAKNKMEGLIAKKLSSLYVSGRSASWRMLNTQARA